MLDTQCVLICILYVLICILLCPYVSLYEGNNDDDDMWDSQCVLICLRACPTLHSLPHYLALLSSHSALLCFDMHCKCICICVFVCVCAYTFVFIYCYVVNFYMPSLSPAILSFCILIQATYPFLMSLCVLNLPLFVSYLPT